jgi:hypothetical protein
MDAPRPTARDPATATESAAGLRSWRRGWLLLGLLWVVAAHACATPVEPWQDARIEAEVKARLVAQKTANLTRLGVVSRKATVHLTGAVESPDQKALAEELARDVSGVKQVVDDVEVRPAPK